MDCMDFHWYFIDSKTEYMDNRLQGLSLEPHSYRFESTMKRVAAVVYSLLLRHHSFALEQMG